MRFFTAFIVWFCLFGVSRSENINAGIPFVCEGKIACATNSVVSVLPNWPPNLKRNEEPEGSGVVLLDGRIIATSDHVIGPAKSVLVRTLQGTVLEAEIVLRDPMSDIALLKIDQPLSSIKIANSYNIGETACAIGNSFGLNISLTCGVVSATQVSGVGFNRIEDFVQTDAAVNPGMSGGALVNQNGELIGLLSAIFTKVSDANLGVNFAVSAQLLSRILNDYASKGRVARIEPGIRVRPSLKLGEVGIGGALVVGMDEQSQEAEGGVRLGDVILHFNGRRINRAGAYVAALALVEKGRITTMNVLRNGRSQNLRLKFD